MPGAGFHIFVPDGVVGTDGVQPTLAGDYGLSATAGTYSPGNGTPARLLASADIRGALISLSADVAVAIPPGYSADKAFIPEALE